MLTNLFTSLSISPKDSSLYLTALTHSSYKTKEEKVADYERLEFLGDAFITLVITDAIFRFYPHKSQGEMTNMRKNFVRSHSLAKLGRNLKLEKYIRTGKSITSEDLLSNDKYFEDTFEALMGAMYLDQGFLITKEYILSLVLEDIKNYDFTTVFDYISKLQEDIQADRRGLPKYETIASGESDKSRMFVSTVSFDGIILGKGYGANFKEAEQNAAKEALSKAAK